MPYLLLRAHDKTAAWWSDHLQNLGYLAELGLRVGISAPTEGASAVASIGSPPTLPVWLQVPERAAQQLPGPQVAFARSCHDGPGVAAALAAGAQWVTLAPLHPTPSKPGHPGIGLPAFSVLAGQWPGRVVALGGIDAANAAAALAAGAAGVAVVRAWRREPDALARACAVP